MENKKAALFIPEGFEEIEAVTAIDILRRGNINVQIFSLTSEEMVKGAHGLTVKADELFENISEEPFDMIIFPGGKGTENYYTTPTLSQFIHRCNENNVYIAAICAAPTFLASLGLLNGKTAVCYPGMENLMQGADLGESIVAVSGNFITSKGPATSPYFALKLVELLAGEDMAEKLYNEMHFELLK